MANTFRMTNETNVSTTIENIYTVPSSTTAVILSVMLSNKGTDTIKGDVQIVSTTATSVNSGAANANETTYVIKDAPNNTGSSLEIMGGNKVILQTGDILKAKSDTASALDIIISYMEIT